MLGRKGLVPFPGCVRDVIFDDAGIITKPVPTPILKKYMSKCQFFHDKAPAGNDIFAIFAS